MKRFLVPLLTIACVVLMWSVALAEPCESKGSAVIPGVHYLNKSSGEWRQTALFLTNTSASEVTCTMSLFDSAGVAVNNKCDVYKGTATPTGATKLATGVDTFTIPANQTRLVIIFKSDQHFIGYGKVEWCSSEPTLSRPMIGTMRYFGGKSGSTTSFAGSMLLNNGMPF